MPKSNRMKAHYLLIALSIFIIGGCTATVQPKTIQVEIVKFTFIPAEVTLNKGDSIIWVNKEKRQYHSVWFEDSGGVESDYFFPGESFTQTFDGTGTFPYRCGPHPKMLGTVTVK